MNQDQESNDQQLMIDDELPEILWGVRRSLTIISTRSV